jgi:isopenicillin N synthase-like dioxygenase
MNFSEMNKQNKIMIISGISVASLALLATIASAFYTPEAPDPKKLGSRTKVAYMASKQFASLPQAEKEKYVKKVGRSRSAYRQLSSTERKKVFSNTRSIMMKSIKERVNKFFAMSEEEQNKYLDDMNARRDKWRKAREARRAKEKSSKTSSNSNNHRGGNRERRRQGFLEGMDSTTRAQMMEIRKRSRARRNQQKK